MLALEDGVVLWTVDGSRHLLPKSTTKWTSANLRECCVKLARGGDDGLLLDHDSEGGSSISVLSQNVRNFEIKLNFAAKYRQKMIEERGILRAAYKT